MNIRQSVSRTAAIAAATLAVAGMALPAAAQMGPGPGMAPGMMMSGHEVRGTIASASPYRVLLARRGGSTIEVDLVHGTVIAPIGTNLTPGMRIVAHGHWSKGTFIAERVALR